jgi:hypothetical protein
MDKTLEGVGLIAEDSDALDHILALEVALGNTDDSIEQAVRALDEMTEMLDGHRPVWRVDDAIMRLRTSVAQPHHVECQVCHLDKITIYDPESEAAYLVGADGRLMLIDTVRYGREYNHYRVKLVNSTVQLPIQAGAHALVSSDHNLTGLTLQEARDAR